MTFVNGVCSVCGHKKEEHRIHIGPDHTGQKIKHVGCFVTVKTEYINDFMSKGDRMPIGYTCSCHGVKPNTYLKKGIKKYQKFLTENKTNDLYRIKEIKNAIKHFKQTIKDNPNNLLFWQKEINKNEN